MTFPTDVADHHKQNLTQKCHYMVAQFKGKDDTLHAQYSERLKTLKAEDSWDFFHEMLVAYQNISGTTPKTSSKPQPKAAPVKKAEVKKAPAKKAAAPAKKEEKKEKKEDKKAAKKVAKKAAKKAVKKAPAKKVAAPAKKAAAKKAPAKKAAPKKAAKKKKK